MPLANRQPALDSSTDHWYAFWTEKLAHSTNTFKSRKHAIVQSKSRQNRKLHIAIVLRMSEKTRRRSKECDTGERVINNIHSIPLVSGEKIRAATEKTWSWS